MLILETERLVLRKWLDEDLATFFAFNQDPKVIEYLAGPLSIEEAQAFIEKCNAHIDQHGFGLYACVIKSSAQLIGFVGLNIPSFEAHFTPCVEIGWRLGSEYWGKGYATEAAEAVLESGFKTHHLKEILSWTVPHNIRSRRVMEKLGMMHDISGDFNHPKLPSSHYLSRHVLYRRAK